MMMKKILVALAAGVSLVASAATDSTFENSKGAKIAYNSKGDIVRGEWTSQFDKARKAAKAEGVPLVVFWANNGCSHCAAVEVALDSSGFRSWMKTQKLYMVFTCQSYPGPCGKTDLNDGAATAKTYAKDPSGRFPYVGVWWNNGGTSLKQRGTFTADGMGASQVEKGIMNLLKGYTPSVGGWFADEEKDLSRYEIEPTTKQVEFILTRASTNKSAGDDEVKLSKTVGGKTTVVKTYKVTWAKNAATASLVVDVPTGLAAGDKLTAVINGETKAKYNCTVYCVEAKPNSAGNPAWKDESFAFGKWTADFVTATNRVATFVGGTAKAYTLVSVQGSLWCPDCANTERNFLDLEDENGDNRFCKWAEKHTVALVSMDIPSYSSDDPNGMASPTLFSRVAVAKALARPGEYPQSGADASMTNLIVRSGLSYLTRKGISSAEAEMTKELFKTLAQKNTDEGGFHLYFGTGPKNGKYIDEDTNSGRTGVPIFVLLRRDGTVAARLTRLASVSPMKADQANFNNYIKRFEEMIAIADGDATEIGNNFVSDDDIKLAMGGKAEGELSNTDMRDVFVFTNFTGAANVEVTISGTSSAEVIAEFWTKKDGKAVPVKWTEITVQEKVNGKWVDVPYPVPVGVTNVINSGKSFTGELADVGTYYLVVKGKDITSREFAVDSGNPTFQTFTVSAKVTSLIPQQTKSTVSVAAGEEISLSVTEGKDYRIVGATPVEGYFEKKGENLFEAQVNGDAKVKADAAGTLEYQEWVPSEIGFNVASESKGESAGTVKVKVLRNGGVSGKVTAKVSLDVENTTFYYDHDDKTMPRFWINGQTKEPYFESTELVWEDGDGEAKEISIKLEQDAEMVKYYGNGKIALTIKDEGDVKIGTADYTLTVKDESKNTKCKISLLKTDPAWDYKAVAYVRKGAGADIELGRSDVGDVLKNYIIVKSSTTKAVVKAGADNALFKSGNKQYWEANDYSNKLVHVDLKKMTAGSSATITLTEKKDSKKKVVSFAADSSSKSVKIYAIDDTAPSFVTNKVGTFKYVTYSYCSESVAFDTAYVKKGDKLSVKLVKGSLPTGIKASVSNGKLCFKGVPTKAGGFTAYYQAQAKRGKQTVKGLVVKASFRIVDPTTVKSTDATYGHLANAAVKSTRTFNTLPVLAQVDGVYRVMGTLNVTIPKSGKISAKFTGREATVSFSATRWAKKSFDDPDGALSCTMTKSGYTLTLEAYPDYTVVATIANEKELEQEASAITAGKVWSSKATAKAWKGIYNAALVPGGKTLYLGNGDPTTLTGGVTEPAATNAEGMAVFAAPQGYGYVNFKMTTKTAYEAGKMTWAGKLPNGQKISGTAYLTKGVDEVIGRTGYAYLPVFQRLTESDSKSKDIVALVAEIQANAETDGGLRYVQGSPDVYPAENALFDIDGKKAPSNFPLGDWEHMGVSGTGTDYGMDLHLFGSYYDPAKDIRKCCADDGKPTEQLLQLVAPAWVGSTSKKVRCEAKEIPQLDHLKIGKNTIVADAASLPAKFTIKLNRDTGVLSGALRVYTADGSKLSSGTTYAEATWTGVMLLGWGADCGCLEDDSLTLPFICGALSFTDEIPYLKADGTTKTVKQLSGGEIYSGARTVE